MTLDVLKRLFVVSNSEPTGKRDLLQESQDSKRLIDSKLYSEVKPYIDYIFEKVNKEIMERARNGYYKSLTSFVVYDNAEATEEDKVINGFGYERLRAVKELLSDKLSLFYYDNLKVDVTSEYSYVSKIKRVYVYVNWEQKDDKENETVYSIVKELFSKKMNVYQDNRDSLKEIAKNSVHDIFPKILEKVNKDIQSYINDGEERSLTSFDELEGQFPYISYDYYEEIKKYLEKELANMYKNRLKINVFSGASAMLVISVDWSQQQKKGLF